MIGTMVSAATGSAHHHPSNAFKTKPPNRIADKYAHSEVWRESDSSARLSMEDATFLFWYASQGMTTSDTAATAIPATLGDGGARRTRVSTD